MSKAECVPAEERRLLQQNVEVVLAAHLAVPVVDGTLKAPAPFAAHLKHTININRDVWVSTEC